MRISEIMTSSAACIGPDKTIQQAAAKMESLDVGALPVCENDRLAGMITDRDITIRAVAQGKNPQEVQVREVMTHDVVYCFEEDSVQQAVRLMRERQVRRLLVLNHHKRLAGIVSLGDLAVRMEDEHLAENTLEAVSTPGHAF